MTNITDKNFLIKFMQSLAKSDNKSKGYIELFKKGIPVGAITLQSETVNQLDIRFENYSSGESDNECTIWLDGICIYFDSFQEIWLPEVRNDSKRKDGLSA